MWHIRTVYPPGNDHISPTKASLEDDYPLPVWWVPCFLVPWRVYQWIAKTSSFEGVGIIFITEGRWELHSTFGCKAWVCVLGPLPGALVVLVPTVVTDLLHEGHGPLVVRVEGGRVLPNGAASVLVSPWPTAGRLLAYDLNAVSCQILELWYQAMMPWCHVVGTKGFLYVCTDPKLAGVTCKSCWVMYIVYIGTTHPPRNGRHHQDYEPFLGAGIPTRKLHLWLEPGWGVDRKYKSKLELLQALNVVAFCYREVASMLRTQWEERIIDQWLG